MTRFTPNKNGFTLIEVIALMIIVSFGVLALVSMQASALLKTNRASHSTTANQLVERVGIRILENASNITAYNGMRTATNEKGNCTDRIPLPNCLKDFSDWQNAVSVLPQGDLTISSVSNSQFEKVTVTISWQDDKGSHNISKPFRVASLGSL